MLALWIRFITLIPYFTIHHTCWPGPKVIKLFSCSTQRSMKFFLLINVQMPTIVGILTFMSGENSILGLYEPNISQISWYFYTYEHLKFYAQLSWAWKKFYNLGPRPYTRMTILTYRVVELLPLYGILQCPLFTLLSLFHHHIIFVE